LARATVVVVAADQRGVDGGDGGDDDGGIMRGETASETTASVVPN
jgi:hypothetical protein